MKRRTLMIKTILFDLDGTLLPMDQEQFTRGYFKRLSAKLAPLGYDPKELIGAIWDGTAAMVQNDGGCTNEELFWKDFSGRYADTVERDRPVFDEYYRVEFQQVAADCGFNPAAAATVDALKRVGYRLALATNPIFPAIATESRIRWAGLRREDFALVTTYENSCHCKPNPDYYRDILSQLDCAAEDCLMVGNDVEEDMVARTLGMQVFLLTDCLINPRNKDVADYPHGSFPELLQFVKTLKN